MRDSLYGDLLRERMPVYLRELQEWVRHPTISSTGEGMGEGAQWIAAAMERAGLAVEVIPLENGYPIVLGYLPGERDATLLVYGHYDVVPPDPLGAWNRDPWSGDIISGRLYGRGAVDNKANHFAWIKALELLRTAGVKPPVGVRLLLEGEEEIGSPHLSRFLSARLEEVRGTVGKVVFEPRQNHAGRPFINLGWKGLLAVELRVMGPPQELHASYSPIVASPGATLARVLASLSEGDQVSIEGFYDDVRPPSEDEVALLGKGKMETMVGLSETLGLPAMSGGDELAALLFNPGYAVCALESGYTGPGMKSSIPISAMARIEFRLVPDQTATRVYDLLRSHLLRKGFQEVEVRVLAQTDPSRTQPNVPLVGAVSQAVSRVFGARCLVYPTLPGTSPDYLFTRMVGIPSVGCGIGYYHLCHCPNEYVEVDQFARGILLALAVLEEVAAMIAG